MNTPKNLILIITILLVTVGQLACAAYLSSLPAIQQVFHTTPGATQLTYNLILFGYGLSMCFYGGLSDYFGCKKLVIISLVIFLVGSVTTCVATNIETLLAARLLQGLGLGGIGIGRAILSDIFSEKDFVKASSYITMSVTITPLLAPVIGGHVQDWFSWRGNFVLILLYGAVVWAYWRGGFYPKRIVLRLGNFLLAICWGYIDMSCSIASGCCCCVLPCSPFPVRWPTTSARRFFCKINCIGHRSNMAI